MKVTRGQSAGNEQKRVLNWLLLRETLIKVLLGGVEGCPRGSPISKRLQDR